MPRIPAAQRGSGAWVSPDAGRGFHVGRHYQPDDLGGICPECQTAIPAALAGMTTHPACEPGFLEAVAELDRQMLRKGTQT